MLPDGYQKRSFLRLNPGLATDRLLADYAAIDDEAWRSSYWGNVHCSIGMLLLRGGEGGHAEDFYADKVVDQPVLATLPYLRELISSDGPFGSVEFAFLFRMEPNGVTLAHSDYMARWHDLYRVHIPIVTNPRAHLVVGDRSQHLAVGYAWTFDNQARHGVVNGGDTRVHLILDVPFNERMAKLLDRAKQLPGEVKKGHLQKIESQKKARPSYPGRAEMMRAVALLKDRGLDAQQIADTFNAKRIPTERYRIARSGGAAAWTAAAVREIAAGA